MSLAAEIIKALVDLGVAIYEDTRNGSVDQWEPILQLFPANLRARVYHETREAAAKRKIERALDTPGGPV